MGVDLHVFLLCAVGAALRLLTGLNVEAVEPFLGCQISGETGRGMREEETSRQAGLTGLLNLTLRVLTFGSVQNIQIPSGTT